MRDGGSPSGRPPAIVFGSGVIALAVSRALRDHGVTPYLVTPPHDIAARSRGTVFLAKSTDIGRSPERISAFLADTPFDRAVLFACNDDWLRSIAIVVDGGSERFLASAPRPDVVDRLIDKGLFAETLQTLDIPRPRTYEARSADDLAHIPDAELRSFFLKPRDSQRFMQDFGVKAFRLGERPTAERMLAHALSAGHDMLAQEWIPGPPQNHVFVDGYVDRHGRLTAVMARRRLRMYPRTFGNSTDSVTIRLSDIADAVESVRRLVTSIDYRGCFDAEFKLDERSNEHKIVEVNARPWWQIDLAEAAGV